MNERTPEIDPRAIGKRIVHLRHLANMSQRDLADLLNVSERSMSDYERGVTVPWPHLRLLEQGFGVGIEYLLYGVEPGGAGDDRAAKRRHAEVMRRLDQLGRDLDQLAVQVRALLASRGRTRQ